MPRLAFSGVELEELYPRLAALADEHMDDPAVDMSDLTLQVGQRIAEGIRATMRTEGPQRRMQGRDCGDNTSPMRSRTCRSSARGVAREVANLAEIFVLSFDPYQVSSGFQSCR